jgi:S1-C subfamily serine protease
MSKKWVIGAVICAGAVTTALVGIVVDVGAARAAPPAASTANATPARMRTLSLAATKKLASAAANVVSPALVDLLADTSTGPRAGTGIVLTRTGEVLTNDHVISGATRITATDIGTGRTYPAIVVGHDSAADIAVLRLTGATGLPTAHLADTAATLGQSVFAVGNANGVGGTAWASGSVTAISRSVNATNEHVKSSESLTGMLQTTAPIVPGYSGGALVNTGGQVLGVDTAGTFSTPGKPATAAFAIPIARAMSIVQAVTAGR